MTVQSDVNTVSADSAALDKTRLPRAYIKELNVNNTDHVLSNITPKCSSKLTKKRRNP